MESKYSPTERLEFEEYANSMLRYWLRIVTTFGFSLVPLFFILDWFTMPAELLTRFAIYRSTTTALVFLHFLALRKMKPGRADYLHGYIISLVVGGMIVKMTVDLGGFSSSYYAGLNLVIVAVILLPWKPIHSALNGLLMIGLYVVANVLFGRDNQAQFVVNNLYFLGGVTVIAAVVAAIRYRQIIEDFNLREELLGAAENLDRSRSELRTARDALWGEMEVAKRIQTALLPPDRRLGGYEVAAAMQPAAEVGGDYYDILETRHGEHWLAIGDVSGHGVESGLVMMMTQTTVSALANDVPGRTPAQVFHHVNRVIRENIARLGSSRFMTLNILRMDREGFLVAGKHQDILIWRSATETVETLSNDGCWIGVVASTEGVVSDMRVPMGDGDLLLLFTDGVTEAINVSGEMYGQERLAEALAAVAQMPVGDAVQALMARINGFHARQEDDVTLMLVRRRFGAETFDGLGAARQRRA